MAKSSTLSEETVHAHYRRSGSERGFVQILDPVITNAECQEKLDPQEIFLRSV